MPANCPDCRRKDNELRSKEYARKYAWKQYFQLVEELYKVREQLQELSVGIVDNNFDIPEHFVDKILDATSSLDCVVCMEAMTKENFNITKCFHEVCKQCIEKVKETTNKCPMCRKDL